MTFIFGMYGIALALLQWTAGGVRTDEAKYLLNIPYPQPPVMRFILSLTENIPHQDLLWRILFALILVWAVTLVWNMSEGLSRTARLFLSGAWLLSAAVALQTGTIMMAPLTAVQALVIVAVAFTKKPKEFSPAFLFLFGLFWLASLFTAYQIVLFFPLVAAVYLRSSISRWQQALYISGPVILVFAYALTNPFILGSFINAGSENLDIPLSWWVWFLLREWITGGSLVLSILGVAGLILHRRWELLLSFLLVSAFVFLSFRDYYDIYFTPLWIAGAVLLFRAHPPRDGWLPWFLVPLTGVTILTAVLLPSITPLGPAREVMAMLQERHATGAILISGPFGHQWQYESRFPVRRYEPEFLGETQAVICLNPCEKIERSRFEKIRKRPEVWVKRALDSDLD